jgi:hypothetical protein
MKRRTLVIALIAFAAVTAAIGTSIAAFVPAVTPTAVWVRKVETDATQGLKDVQQTEEATVTTEGNGNITIRIVDTTPNPDVVVTRVGRNAAGQPLLAPTAKTITVTAVTLP